MEIMELKRVLKLYSIRLHAPYVIITPAPAVPLPAARGLLGTVILSVKKKGGEG